MVDKYIRMYNIRNVKTALLCASIASLPLFLVSLFYDVIAEDTLISFLPFVLAAVVVAFASLYTIRFKKLICKQEQLYGVQFQDSNAKRLETMLYLSDDWLIWAGSCALYRRHIQSLSAVRRYGRSGASNQVRIKTVDGEEYTVWCLNASHIKEIREWKNR